MSDETAMSFEEGSAACPFLAFYDDRDHRSDFADTQHRCYAAPEPEPIETGHQERYCLAVAFATCPVFLEWARAEAAGVAEGRSAGAAVPAGFGAATAGAARSRGDSEAPAFLAGSGRTTPAEAVPVTAAHASDPGSGLWGFEGAPKRTVAPTAPAAASGSFDTATPPMPRHQPTKPDWENPPRYENFPRLRARDDRNNQPLLLAALGVTVLMLALIVVPLLSPKGGGPSPSSSHSAGTASPSASTSVAPPDNPNRTFMVYRVKPGDNLNGIAQGNGISYAQLIAANPQITNPNHIEVGQIIYIPWQTWVPSPTASPTPTPTPIVTPYH
jgi:LysM repeat protein